MSGAIVAEGMGVAPAEPRWRGRSKIRIVGMLGWRWVAGAALCGSVALAVVVLGWSLRLGRRWGLRAAGIRDGRPLPNLLIGEIPGAGFFPRVLGGLWTNIKVGVQAAANAWVVTLPGGLLMHFSWSAGWMNSFTKGYEDAAVGPLVGFLGIFLFMAAMAYLPMAQARQAVTGKGRRFWDYRRIRQVMAQRWFSCLWLGVAYVGAGFVLLIADALLAFLTNGRPDLADVPRAQLLGELKLYFLLWGFFVFPAFVFLRAWAARIYVRGVADLLRSGKWTERHLCDEDKAWAGELERGSGDPSPAVVRVAKHTGVFAGRNVARVALFVVWFGFVAEIYVAQFFVARSVQRWLSQPLVQVPWFRYLPDHLVEAAEAELAAESK